MRAFKTKPFHKWAKKVKLSDSALKSSISEIESGLFDAFLGSNLFKKRIPIGSKGKRGGVRTIFIYKKGHRLIFLSGFEKNQRENIDPKELEALRKFSNIYLKLSDKDLEALTKKQSLIEIGEQ